MVAPTSLPGFIGAMATMVVVVAVGGIFGEIHHKDVPIEPKVQAAMQKCIEDGALKRSCIGGFLKDKDGAIYRIASCGRKCGPVAPQIEGVFLADQEYTGTEHVFTTVALPGEPGWDEMAIAHAWQFVSVYPSQQRKP